MLGQLVLAFFELQIGAGHPGKIEPKTFSREQSLLEAVPVAGPDEAGVADAELELERPLGALGDLDRKLVSLEIGRRNLREHPAVELLVRVLLSHVRVGFLGMRDLLFVHLHLVVRERLLQVARRNERFDMIDLQVGLIAGVGPLFVATAPATRERRGIGLAGRHGRAIAGPDGAELRQRDEIAATDRQAREWPHARPADGKIGKEASEVCRRLARRRGFDLGGDGREHRIAGLPLGIVQVVSRFRVQCEQRFIVSVTGLGYLFRLAERLGFLLELRHLRSLEDSHRLEKLFLCRARRSESASVSRFSSAQAGRRRGS